MDRTDLLVDQRRLLDLAQRLELVEVSETLAGLDDPEPARLASDVLAAGQQLLREVAARRVTRLPPLPGAEKRWDRLAPLLAGLESMSRRELGEIDAAARRARAEVDVRFETLPAIWRAKCRSTLASAAVSPDSLDSAGVEAVTARLERRVASGITSVCRNVARQVDQALLRQVTAALDALYPLAATCDQMLRAGELGPLGSGDSALGKGDGATQAPSLVARLAERRRAAELSGIDSDPAATAARLAALASVLGAETLPAAVEILRSTPVPALSSAGAEGTAPTADAPRHEQLRTAVLETARSAVDRAWESRRHSIAEAVGGHVAERFTALQREIDGWLDEARRHLATLCGRPSEADEELDAVRFEVLDICRRVEQAGDVT